jgi:replicative DNA helicase
MIALDQLERSVIGAVLVDPSVMAILPTLESAHFFSWHAQVAWEAFRNLEHANKPIDVVTVMTEIEGQGNKQVDESYLGQCVLQCPIVSNAIEYANLIRDAALKRRLLNMLGGLQHAANESTGAELLTMATAGLSALDAELPEQAQPIGELVRRRVKQLEDIAKERALGHRTLTGYWTGVSVLDEKISGWQPGIVSIVAARPGMGKSSLGLATADACSKAGFGVHLFSLEDTEEAYADRGLSRESGVPAETLRNAQITNGQMHDVTRAFRTLTQRKGWLVDGRSGITAMEIVRSVRRHKKSNGTKVAIVDYVQLVTKPDRRMTAHEALSEIVTTFADAAKQDGIAYVVMSQLNRELEKREDKRPQLSDLRESGSLEERAKCVVGVYRGSVYYPDAKRNIDYSEDQRQPSRDEFVKQVQLIVLKNSNGRTGRVFGTWLGPTTRME